MIASLMMYARSELTDAHARYWALIRANLSAKGMDSPEHLAQEAEEFSVWNDPNLVLSQTCGMPYRIWLHSKVTLAGTPDFGVEGCPPGYYRSALVVRKDDKRQMVSDYRDALFAYNQTFSQSGYAAAYWHCDALDFWFGNRLHTEQHRLSALAVAEGRADIASLDAVSWRLMQEYEPFAKNLRVLEWTEPTPGLPLITAKGNDAGLIFDAVSDAIVRLPEADRVALGVRGLVRIDLSAYRAVLNPPGTE